MPNSVSFHDLNPLAFLDRSAAVYPNKPAVIYNDKTYSYAEFNDRVNRLAGALRQAGVNRGDRVAFMLPNIPQMLEGHYGPMRLGAMLVAINIRLSAREIAYILNHSGAKVLVFDSEFADTVRAMDGEIPGVETVVQVADVAPMAEDIESGGVRGVPGVLASGHSQRGAGLRARPDIDQLHLRHHRNAEGRPVPRSRRVPERAWRGAGVRSDLEQHLPVDAADVPLQRLVPHLGRHGSRRYAPVPA